MIIKILDITCKWNLRPFYLTCPQKNLPPQWLFKHTIPPKNVTLSYYNKNTSIWKEELTLKKWSIHQIDIIGILATSELQKIAFKMILHYYGPWKNGRLSHFYLVKLDHISIICLIIIIVTPPLHIVKKVHNVKNR